MNCYERKDTYKITPRGNRLTMRGYIGVSLLGRSATWIRID